MQMTDSERLELARFFAKRLTPELRSRPSTTAPDPAAWEALLGGPNMPSAVRRAAAVLPDDANLQAAVAELLGPRKWPTALVAGVGAAGIGAVAVAAVAVLAVGGLTLIDSTTAPDMAPAPALAATAPAPQPTPSQPAPLAGSADLAAAPAVEGSPPEAAARPDVVESRSSKPATAPTSRSGTAGPERCVGAEPGAIVGYWHAGEATPGRSGEVLQMPHGRNVRADYPDEHNRFDARAEVQCQLHRGDRVRLSRDPIRVPGGHYWVPLLSGDLMGGQS
ncbi:MAG: hypothetical protein ACI8PZ_000237 [Myxococcota bacterium]|jgi:hypothetical protein